MPTLRSASVCRLTSPHYASVHEVLVRGPALRAMQALRALSALPALQAKQALRALSALPALPALQAMQEVASNASTASAASNARGCKQCQHCQRCKQCKRSQALPALPPLQEVASKCSPHQAHITAPLIAMTLRENPSVQTNTATAHGTVADPLLHAMQSNARSVSLYHGAVNCDDVA